MNITKIRHRPEEWITKAEAQNIAHCSHTTMSHVIKEMESLVGKRYKYPVTAVGVSSATLIDRLAFNDYIRNRKKIKSKVYCPPYNPKIEAWALGYIDETIAV